MKSSYKILLLAFLSLWLILGLNACGDDNSTGPEENCDISLPSEFAPVVVDVSYFEAQTEPEVGNPEFQTYFQVEQLAMQANTTFTGSPIFQLAPQLLTFARLRGIEPEFQDGSCVWTISPPPAQTQGLELTISVIGTSTSSGANWEIIYDGDLTDGGSVQDYKILTGSTSTENGEWNYFTPEDSNSPALTYDWNVEADDDYDFSVTASAEEFSVATVSYSKGGVQNSLSIDTGDGLIETFWDEDLNSGWIEMPDQERQCYIEFRNNPCQ